MKAMKGNIKQSKKYKS